MTDERMTKARLARLVAANLVDLDPIRQELLAEVGASWAEIDNLASLAGEIQDKFDAARIERDAALAVLREAKIMLDRYIPPKGSSMTHQTTSIFACEVDAQVYESVCAVLAKQENNDDKP